MTHTDPILRDDPTPNLTVLTLNRPQQLNAINKELLLSLEAHLTQLKNQSHKLAVIVTGAGTKAFAAGADIKELSQCSPAEAHDISRLGQRVFQMLWDFDGVTLAAVNGFALGGGLELALGCNLIFASENAQFGLPEVNLGLIPGFGGTQRLKKRLGTSRALEWTCSGQRYGCHEAFQWGLVNVVVKSTPQDLMTQALSFCEQITSQGPMAVRAAKKAILWDENEGAPGSTGMTHEQDLFRACFERAESREGISAFLEKRKPNF